jgi:hypothetical protein
VAGAELRIDDHSLICLRSTASGQRGHPLADRAAAARGVGGLHPAAPHRGGHHRVRQRRPVGPHRPRAGRGPGRDRPPRLPRRAPRPWPPRSGGTDPRGRDGAGWAHPHPGHVQRPHGGRRLGPALGHGGRVPLPRRRRDTSCRSRGPPTTGARAPPDGWPRPSATGWWTRSSPGPRSAVRPAPVATSTVGAPRSASRQPGPPPRQRVAEEPARGAGTDGTFERGRWAVAVAVRVPVTRRGRDRRSASSVATRPAGWRSGSCRTGRAAVRPSIGTHMSHITHGSHAQYRRLGARLPHADRPPPCWPGT